MILCSKSQDQNWEVELGQSLRSAQELAAAGLIGDGEIARYTPLLRQFKFLLPRYYASLIDPADPHCPIRRQAIPTLDEMETDSFRFSDPLQDLKHQPVPRITHRYPNRVLLHLTPNCSMYCRYCFRKTLLNDLSEGLFQGGLEPAISYLREHSEIEEVIFSGGDPFMVRDTALNKILEDLVGISHLQRLRFHTRVPVTFPSRVTEALVVSLTKTRFPIVVVTHFNHPKELTAMSRKASTSLRRAGIFLLNQSVLLRGVNDDEKSLTTLSRSLFEAEILPYYLHHPDPSKGTGHFDVTTERGLQLHHELKIALPGYLVPKYVIDVVGSPYKSEVH